MLDSASSRSSPLRLAARVKLPSVPVNKADLATGGLITLAAVVVATLLAAALGGKAGQRYHRKVDRLA